MSKQVNSQIIYSNTRTSFIKLANSLNQIVLAITFYSLSSHCQETAKETFRSFSQAATCPPVYHTWWRLHTVPLIAERQTGKLRIPIFIVFGLTRPGIEPKSTVSVADAQSTRPLIGNPAE